MAQDASTLTHLKYGDQCTLENVDNSGFISVTKAVSISALMGTGDQSEKAEYERRMPHSFELHVEVLDKGVSMPPNLGSCVFEVLPKRQYVAQKAFTKELAKGNWQRDTWRGAHEEEKLASASGRRLTVDEVHKSARLSEAAQQSLAVREAAEKAEQSHNSVEYARSVGIAVLFGQVVQLYHPGTNSFVTLKNARAALERNHMRMVAQVGGDEGSWFLIQPAYKTKVDGEKVAFRDVITFASVKFPGVSLRVSDLINLYQRKSNPVYVRSVHEVCGSRDPTALKVLPYALHESLIPRSSLLLHGGQTILLRHRATGSCLSYEDGRVLFKPEQNASPDDLPNSNLLWKLEADVVEWSGMPVIARRKYRLKHLASRKYLISNVSHETRGTGLDPLGMSPTVKETALQVTDAFNTGSTLWVVHPMDSLITDGAVMPINSLVHCQNAEWKGWISAAAAARPQDFWSDTPANLERRETLVAVSAAMRMDREALECAPVDPAVVALLRTIGSAMLEFHALVSELAVLPEIPLLGEAPSKKTPPENMDLFQLLMNE